MKKSMACRQEHLETKMAGTPEATRRLEQFAKKETRSNLQASISENSKCISAINLEVYYEIFRFW